MSNLFAAISFQEIFDLVKNTFLGTAETDIVHWIIAGQAALLIVVVLI